MRKRPEDKKGMEKELKGARRGANGAIAPPWKFLTVL